MPWQPTTILRFEGSVASSSGVLRVVTDEGKGYLKALGNPEGPQVLARASGSERIWQSSSAFRRLSLRSLR